MSFFKDISEDLAKKYPSRKVYVISDHHFYHKNIINFTRSSFLGDGNVNTSVDAMNEYIIQEHNRVVGVDDIVIVLGDFSFKASNQRLLEITQRMNGHKFLVLGNHDNFAKPHLYLKAGFEGVYFFPIKFNEDYYSHYPLNATVESGDRPNTVLYGLLSKEFSQATSGINYHGHQHVQRCNGSREKNVSCEQSCYRPILVGQTKSYCAKSEGSLSYINDEIFSIAHDISTRFEGLQEKIVVIDYIYTILLELLSQYGSQIAVFGSYILNKKHGAIFYPSDLDVTKIYDPAKSRKENLNEMKSIVDAIYKELNQIPGMNLDFYKRIGLICIISFVYVIKEYQLKGFMDMNALLAEFYNPEDFTIVAGQSKLEYYATMAGINTPQTIRYPRFNVHATNSLADFTNCFLHYIYTTDDLKKRILLQKMEIIAEAIVLSDENGLAILQNMIIRYFLRNIYFLENANRTDEVDSILSTGEIILPSGTLSNRSLEEALNGIIVGSQYRGTFDELKRYKCRSKVIPDMLQQYK